MDLTQFWPILIITLVIGVVLLYREYRRKKKRNPDADVHVLEVSREAREDVTQGIRTGLQWLRDKLDREEAMTTNTPPTPSPTLAEALTPVSPVGATPLPSATTQAGGWPREVAVGGVTIMAKAPINPLWRPSVTGSIFGGMFLPVHKLILSDPSNGDRVNPPQPLRTHMGFPLYYALGENNVQVGTPSVVIENQHFNNDAEVMKYLSAHPPKDNAEQWAVWAQAFQQARTPAPPPPPGPAPVPVTVTQPVTEPSWGSPVVGVAQGLKDMYGSIVELQNHAASLHWNVAVLVDGVVVVEGFGPPINYNSVTNSAQIVRAP